MPKVISGLIGASFAVIFLVVAINLFREPGPVRVETPFGAVEAGGPSGRADSMTTAPASAETSGESTDREPRETRDAAIEPKSPGTRGGARPILEVGATSSPPVVGTPLPAATTPPLVARTPDPGELRSRDWVTLFEHDDFRGRSYRFDASVPEVADLKRDKTYAFGDKTSSIQWNIESNCQFELFDDDTFRRSVRVIPKGSGSYRDLHEQGFEDKISSVRWKCP